MKGKPIQTIIILPIMGGLLLLFSIPFFFITQPFVVFYGGAILPKGGGVMPPTAEVIDSGTGAFFGIWLAATGAFLIYLYFRIQGRFARTRPHPHEGRRGE